MSLDPFNITASHGPATSRGLTKDQYKEVLKIVDSRFDDLKSDIDNKIDELLDFNKGKWARLDTLKEDLKTDIVREFKGSRFQHSFVHAALVGAACYIATIMGVKTLDLIGLVLGVL